jgi:hypothetical protein
MYESADRATGNPLVERWDVEGLATGMSMTIADFSTVNLYKQITAGILALGGG